MFMDALHRAALEDFRRYLYASWCEAFRTNPPKGRGAVNAASAIRQERAVLQHLCDPNRDVVFDHGESRDVIGFMSDTKGLWVKNGYLGSIAGTQLSRESLIRFFHHERTIYGRLKTFFETQKTRHTLDPTQFGRDDQAFLRRLGWNGKRVKYCGRILIGAKDAVTWIGISVIEESTFPNPETVADRFLSPLQIRRAPDVPIASWYTLAPHSRDDVNWEAVGNDLLLAMQQAQMIAPTATLVSVGLTPDADLRRVTREAVERGTARAGRTIQNCWVFTNLTFSAVEAPLREALAGLPRNPALVVRVLDGERLSGYLARFPWVWSKHFGSRCGFRVFANGNSARAALVDGDDPATFFADRDRYRTVINGIENDLRAVVGDLISRTPNAEKGIDRFLTTYREALRDVGVDVDEFPIYSSYEPVDIEARLRRLAKERHSDTVDNWMRGYAPRFVDALWQVIALPDLKDRLPVDTSIAHPVLKQISVEAGGSYRVRGCPGAGKSAVCYRILANDLRDDIAILVSPCIGEILTSADKDLIDELLSNAADVGVSGITVVIDRMEREVGLTGAATLLHRVLARRDALQRARKSMHVTVIVSHWPPDAHFNATYGITFREWSFVEMDLDKATTPAFIAGIAGYASDALNIELDTLDEDVVNTCADRTPRQLIEAILWYAEADDSIPAWHDVSFWSAAYEELTTAGERSDAALVLRILAAFENFGTALDVSNISLYFCGWLSKTRAELEEALILLDKRGWIRYFGARQVIAIDDSRVAALMSEWRTTGDDVIEAFLSQTTTATPPVRVRILENALRFSKIERRIGICRRLVELAPERTNKWVDAAVVCGALAVKDDVIGPLMGERGLIDAALQAQETWETRRRERQR
jgi:hypothetical protein